MSSFGVSVLDAGASIESSGPTPSELMLDWRAADLMERAWGEGSPGSTFQLRSMALRDRTTGTPARAYGSLCTIA
jgi:hypothetical protein